jgi:hypothetical protein
MNWYKQSQLNNEDNGDNEDIQNLGDMVSQDGKQMQGMGLRGQAKYDFLEELSGTPSYLVRYRGNDGEIRTALVSGKNTDDAMSIAINSAGIDSKLIIDIQQVNSFGSAMSDLKSFSNNPFTDAETEALRFLGITNERIEEVIDNPRMLQSFRRYLQQHGFNLKRQSFKSR